jgi:beta-lactamase regulating signal transducer with metallopeptidase domain
MMQGAMDPDLLLCVVAAIAGFLLKTTLAFGACVALSRLVHSANFRFVIWASFVYGAVGYWLYLWNTLWAGGQQFTMAPMVRLQPAKSAVGGWQIPTTWAFPLTLTLGVMGILYVLTLFYLICSHLGKRRHLKWVLTFTSEPPVDVAEKFQSLAKTFHAGRSKLLILSGATSPATFGWIRPIVLLPTSCLEEDPAELEDILRHELHHVRRWDAVWNGFALASRALLFFHPGVWYAVQKMQFDRELACDLAVVSQAPARRGKYAECLIRFARLNVMPEPSGWGIDFAASAQHLTLRVHSILAGSKKSPGWLLCLRIASGLTISAVFLGVAPSLAVLLSFAHEPVATKAFTSVLDAPSREAHATANRRVRASASPTEVPGAARLGQIEADRPGIDLPANPEAAKSARQGSAGPQLLHRGDASAPGNDSAKSQIIGLLDTDAKGQSAKSGGGTGAAVQQTATAALGLYKRLSTLDRH